MSGARYADSSSNPPSTGVFNEDEILSLVQLPTMVQPKFDEPGGGTEILHNGDANIGPTIRWIPIN